MFFEARVTQRTSNQVIMMTRTEYTLKNVEFCHFFGKKSPGKFPANLPFLGCHLPSDHWKKFSRPDMDMNQVCQVFYSVRGTQRTSNYIIWITKDFFNQKCFIPPPLSLEFGPRFFNFRMTLTHSMSKKKYNATYK